MSRSQKNSVLSRVLNSRLHKKKIDETVEAMFDVSKVSNEALTWPFSLCISCDLEEHSSTYTYKFFYFIGHFSVEIQGFV